MMRVHWGHYVFGIFLGVGAIACSGRAIQLVSPHDDAGVDPGMPVPDAAADAASNLPQDASGDIDGDAGATNTPSTDSGIDASNVSDGPGGGPADAADEAGDANTPADARDASDASSLISCAETTTCATPVQLPLIYGGDVGGPNQDATVSGTHSEWYQIQVQPDPTAATLYPDISVGVFLYPPLGMTLDMEIYLNLPPNYLPATCSQPYATSSGDAGARQQINVRWPRGGGLGDEGWVTVHVITKPGTQCQTGDSFNLEFIGG